MALIFSPAVRTYSLYVLAFQALYLLAAVTVARSDQRLASAFEQHRRRRPTQPKGEAPSAEKAMRKLLEGVAPPERAFDTGECTVCMDSTRCFWTTFRDMPTANAEG